MCLGDFARASQCAVYSEHTLSATLSPRSSKRSPLPDVMGSLADALLSHRAPPDNLNNSLLRQIVRLQETLAVANEREQGLMQQLRSTAAEVAEREQGLMQMRSTAAEAAERERGLMQQLRSTAAEAAERERDLMQQLRWQRRRRLGTRTWPRPSASKQSCPDPVRLRTPSSLRWPHSRHRARMKMVMRSSD